MCDAMSLASMLKAAPVRAMFRETFPVSRPRLRGRLLAPPISGRPAHVGAAFDYLLRFTMEREFDACVASTWTAERAVARLNDGAIECGEGLRSEAVARLAAAIAARHEYVHTGVLTDGLLGAVLDLAQLDAFYWTGTARGFVDASAEDTDDLRGLLGVARRRFPVPLVSCWLNPDFGEASELVGGADADLIVDGALIDVRTTGNLSFGQKLYNQVVGCYILSRLGGVNGGEKADLSAVGVYFARYGVTHMIPTAGIREAADGAFMDAFEKAAREMFPG